MSRPLITLTAALVLVSSGVSASSLQQAMKDVERIRGVSFTSDVTQRTVDRAELPKVLRAQMAKELPYSLDDYALILRSLQLVDSRTTGIVDRMIKLYEGQVLAFYDPQTHVYYAISELPAVVTAAGGGGMLKDAVAVHELTHALQDQRFGASQREQALRRDTDGELAYHALLEGEATLVMTAWMLDKVGGTLDEAVKGDASALLLGADNGLAETMIDSSVPRYFVASMKFPYFDGMKLVVEGYRRGGWAMIDRMHKDPPRSTSEVLHPQSYFERLGKPGSNPAPIDGKTDDPNVLTVEHLGEFHWRYLAGDAATGWVDDRVLVLRDGTVLADTSWDSGPHAVAFRDAYAKFLRGRGIDPQIASDGKRVRVAYGPDIRAVARFAK